MCRTFQGGLIYAVLVLGLSGCGSQTHNQTPVPYKSFRQPAPNEPHGLLHVRFGGQATLASNPQLWVYIDDAGMATQLSIGSNRTSERTLRVTTGSHELALYLAIIDPVSSKVSKPQKLRIELQGGAEHVIFVRFESSEKLTIHSYRTNTGASDVAELEASWKELLQTERKYEEEREQRRAASREFAQAMGLSADAIADVPLNWPEAVRDAPDLTGTTWIADCKGCGRGPETLRLLPSGKLEVPSKYEAHYGDPKDASWKQRGNKLYIRVNKVKSANVSLTVHIYATVSADAQSLTSYVETRGLMRNSSYTDWVWRRPPISRQH